MDVIFRPLVWVGTRTPASNRRSRWTFKASWSDTLILLDRELNYLKAFDVTLQADFGEWDLTKSGMPRANARQPADPGVVLGFETKALGRLSYPCDSCDFWQHNVRSIALGLEALRAVDRYGITQQAQQYTGFKAIGGGTPMPGPEPLFGTADQAWAYIQGLTTSPEGVTRSVKSAMNAAVREHHPDVRPESPEWPKIDQARQLLKTAGML